MNMERITIAEREHLKLLEKRLAAIIREREDVEWAEECAREKDAGIQAANQSLIYGGGRDGY